MKHRKPKRTLRVINDVQPLVESPPRFTFPDKESTLSFMPACMAVP